MYLFSKFCFKELLSFLYLGIILLISGCALKSPTPSHEPNVTAQKCWSTFWKGQKQNNLPHKGCRVEAGLRLITPGGKHRLSIELWGNYALPLRINLKTPFGSIFSLWRVDSEYWTAYYPNQNKAFLNGSSKKGLASLGFNLPFELQELVLILTGHWYKTIPQKYRNAEFIPGQGWRYKLEDEAKVSSILLNQQAQVKTLFGKSPESWSMHFKEYKDFQTKSVASKIAISTGEKFNSFIFLKLLKEKKHPWNQDSLQLNLPQDSEIIML